MTEEQMNIIRQNLLHYGKAIEINKCIEECAELTNELCKTIQGKTDYVSVCSEIADVMITTQQMAMVFGEKEVEKQIQTKLERQLQRINNEKADNDNRG